jgi:hypothetical protein
MGRQHGVASRRQLRKIGFGPDRVDSWVRRGLLVPIERGVYGATGR